MAETANQKGEEPAEKLEEDGAAGHAPPVGEYNILDHETIERVFRTQTNFGVDVLPEFREHKERLSQIYNAIYRLQLEAFQKRQFEFPELRKLYTSFKDSRRGFEEANLLPDAEEFTAQICILSAQEPAFACTLREIALGQGSALTIKTKYVITLREFEDAVASGYRSAVAGSAKILKACMNQESFFANWPAILNAITGSEKFQHPDLFKERLDPILKRLFLFTEKRPHFVKAHVDVINNTIKERIFKPIVTSLNREGVILVMSCKDVRASTQKVLKQQPDLIFLKNEERLKERYLNLCRIITSDPAQKVIQSDFMLTIRAQMDDEDVFLENSSRLALTLLEEVKGGRELPANLVHMIVEISRLKNWHETHNKQQELKQNLSDVNTVVDAVRAQPSLVDVKKGRKLMFDERIVRMVLADKVPPILGYTDFATRKLKERAEYSLSGAKDIYFLYKDRAHTSAAINAAVELFDSKGDDFFLRLLEEMFGLARNPDEELKKYIAPISLNLIREKLTEVYKEYLPWTSKLMMFLFRKDLSKDRVNEIKGELRGQDKENLRRMEGQMDKNFKSQVKEKAAAMVKEKDAVSRERKPEAPRSASVPDSYVRIQEYVKSKWNRGAMPMESDIVKQKELGPRDDLNLITAGVKSGSAEFSKLIGVGVEGGDRIYLTSEFLENQKEELKTQCLDVIEEIRGQLGNSNMRGSSHIRNMRRREAKYTALMNYLLK